MSKLKKEIEEIVYQIKAVEIEGSPTIMDYHTAIDKLHTLIRQREKELLKELEVKLIAEEAKGRLGVPAPRVLDTFIRKLSNE